MPTTHPSPPPLLVIMGPTASGKSSLAIEVAERLDGEIVSADAYAVYRGMNIGTDKPNDEACRRIPHHLIDVVDADQGFSAGHFITLATREIDSIHRRGRTALVVGGTHFYIQALLHGLFPSPPKNPELRAQLESAWEKDANGVFERLQDVDPEAADKIGPKDRQRLLRALEVYEATGTPISVHWQSHEKSPRYSSLVTAPKRPRADLYDRIDRRVDDMFAMGFVEEVEHIIESGVPPESRALKAIGYREIVDFLNQRCTREEAIERTKRSSRKYAKRQISWLRLREKGVVHWVAPTENGGASQISIMWADHLCSIRPNTVGSSRST